MSRGWCLGEEVVINVAQVEMLVVKFFFKNYSRLNNYKIRFDNQ
jgi:hypothetical protein